MEGLAMCSMVSANFIFCTVLITNIAWLLSQINHHMNSITDVIKGRVCPIRKKHTSRKSMLKFLCQFYAGVFMDSPFVV